MFCIVKTSTKPPKIGAVIVTNIKKAKTSKKDRKKIDFNVNISYNIGV